jgi:hypothetical protein
MAPPAPASALHRHQSSSLESVFQEGISTKAGYTVATSMKYVFPFTNAIPFKLRKLSPFL